jgi:hypothetical protein
MPGPVRLQEVARRRDFPAPRPDSRDHLSQLVRRVAAKDRTAFAELHRALSPPLVTFAHSRGLAPADITAVLSATFTEVWWMARFHTSAADDILTWTTDIVLRRVADRDDGRGAATTAHDQHTASVLSGLLRPALQP